MWPLCAMCNVYVIAFTRLTRQSINCVRLRLQTDARE